MPLRALRVRRGAQDRRGSVGNDPETRIYSPEKLSKKTRRIVPVARLGSPIWSGDSRNARERKRSHEEVPPVRARAGSGPGVHDADPRRDQRRRGSDEEASSPSSPSQASPPRASSPSSSPPQEDGSEEGLILPLCRWEDRPSCIDQACLPIGIFRCAGQRLPRAPTGLDGTRGRVRPSALQSQPQSARRKNRAGL